MPELHSGTLLCPLVWVSMLTKERRWIPDQVRDDGGTARDDGGTARDDGGTARGDGGTVRGDGSTVRDDGEKAGYKHLLTSTLLVISPPKSHKRNSKHQQI